MWEIAARTWATGSGLGTTNGPNPSPDTAGSIAARPTSSKSQARRARSIRARGIRDEWFNAKFVTVFAVFSPSRLFLALHTDVLVRKCAAFSPVAPSADLFPAPSRKRLDSPLNAIVGWFAGEISCFRSSCTGISNAAQFACETIPSLITATPQASDQQLCASAN